MNTLLSMTGFGTFQEEIIQKKIMVEIRVLNSKTFDLHLKIPSSVKPFEFALRNLLSENLLRGKVECNLKIESLSQAPSSTLNWNILKNYVQQLRQFSEEEAIPTSDLLSIAIGLPQVFENEQASLSAEEWLPVESAVLKSIEQTLHFRQQEGEKLMQDIQLRNNNILTLLEKIEEINAERKIKIENKLKDSLSKIMKEVEIDKNRLEQELIFYIERADITEEIVRLKSHSQFFEITLHHSDMEKGKKLGFIAQEMGREINTIGSKAAHAEMQKTVVAMKDELEKIKEQLNNVL